MTQQPEFTPRRGSVSSHYEAPKEEGAGQLWNHGKIQFVVIVVGCTIMALLGRHAAAELRHPSIINRKRIDHRPLVAVMHTMKLPRFSLRDLFWLVALVAVSLAWWLDHRKWVHNYLLQFWNAHRWEERANGLARDYLKPGPGQWLEWNEEIDRTERVSLRNPGDIPKPEYVPGTSYGWMVREGQNP